MYPNIDKIARVNCPVFYMHAQDDEISPIECSYQLYNQTRRHFTPWWVKKAGHNLIIET